MDTWWTSPLEDDNGNLIMVTGRKDIDEYRSNPRYCIRINISIPYEATPSGMPTDKAAEQLEEILDRIQAELKKDPTAVLTGIYTGGGTRDMVFYAKSTFIFDKKLNAALAPLPLLPLKITAENDPQWAEYDEMRNLSEIH